MATSHGSFETARAESCRERSIWPEDSLYSSSSRPAVARKTSSGRLMALLRRCRAGETSLSFRPYASGELIQRFRKRVTLRHRAGLDVPDVAGVLGYCAITRELAGARNV